LSFELSEDISDEDDIDTCVDNNDLISKPNIDSDACFIIFWENNVCSNIVKNVQQEIYL